MTTQYSKQNPFYASIKKRYDLTKVGSQKKTQHLELDIKGSGLSYEVGDSVGIFARHDPELIKKTLDAMRATGFEIVQVKQTDEKVLLVDYLSSRGNITDISPKLLREVYTRQIVTEKKQDLEPLLEETQREAMKEYLGRHEVWDFSTRSRGSDVFSSRVS